MKESETENLQNDVSCVGVLISLTRYSSRFKILVPEYC